MFNDGKSEHEKNETNAITATNVEMLTRSFADITATLSWLQEQQGSIKCLALAAD